MKKPRFAKHPKNKALRHLIKVFQKIQHSLLTSANNSVITQVEQRKGNKIPKHPLFRLTIISNYF